MNNNNGKTLAAAAIVLVLGGCVQGHNGPKQTGGTLIGAGLGALAGTQVGRGRGKLAAVAIGALAGAAIGSEFGRSLDRADQIYLQRATARAGTAPLGRPVHWSNPRSGNYGTIVPMREGTHRYSGAHCRNFRQSVTVRGRTREYLGSACQSADGSWNVM